MGRCGGHANSPFDGQHWEDADARPPRGRARRIGRQSFAVIRSISRRSSAVSTQPAARTLASSCSGFVAPAMMLDTQGRAASQLKASSSKVLPRVLGERFQPFDDRPVRVVDEAAAVARTMDGQPRAFRHRRVAPVLAGQQTARQRIVRQQAHAVGLHHRDQLAIRTRASAGCTRSGRIRTGQARACVRSSAPRPPARRGSWNSRCSGPCPARTRSSNARKRLLDRRQRIRLVLLIEIDPVGVQPPQAGLDAGNDGAARRTVRPAIARPACRPWWPARCPCAAAPAPARGIPRIRRSGCDMNRRCRRT